MSNLKKHQLHNFNGKAAEWKDGFGFYAINGVNLPDNLGKFIDTPAHEINIDEVLSIPNTYKNLIIQKIRKDRMREYYDSKKVEL